MSWTIPPITRTVLQALESSTEPTVDYEISGKLSGVFQTPDLTDNERKGAWAEAAAFNLMPTKESPWGTHYGPQFAATKPDGTPQKLLDISRISSLGWTPHIGLREGIAASYRAALDEKVF